MKANEEKRREALKKIAALGAMAVFQPARAVPATNTSQTITMEHNEFFIFFSFVGMRSKHPVN